MGHFKIFLFGLFTAYGIYYSTRKGPEGKSVLDDLLANTQNFMYKAKDYAIQLRFNFCYILSTAKICSPFSIWINSNL